MAYLEIISALEYYPSWISDWLENACPSLALALEIWFSPLTHALFPLCQVFCPGSGVGTSWEISLLFGGWGGSSGRQVLQRHGFDLSWYPSFVYATVIGSLGSILVIEKSMNAWVSRMGHIFPKCNINVSTQLAHVPLLYLPGSSACTHGLQIWTGQELAFHLLDPVDQCP